MKKEETMRPDFEKKLNTFVEGCKRIQAEHFAAGGFEENPTWNVT